MFKKKIVINEDRLRLAYTVDGYSISLTCDWGGTIPNDEINILPSDLPHLISALKQCEADFKDACACSIDHPVAGNWVEFIAWFGAENWQAIDGNLRHKMMLLRQKFCKEA